MSDMRLLARLYVAFTDRKESPSHSAADIFQRVNFKILEEAIEDITTCDGTLKYGTKNSLYYLLKSYSKIMMAHYLSNDEDERAKEIENFRHVLELNQSFLFGDATSLSHTTL